MRAALLIGAALAVTAIPYDNPANCSHTTCEMKQIVIDLTKAHQVAGCQGATASNPCTHHVMIMHHSSDETKCHKYTSTQAANGDWQARGAYDGTSHTGVHCGLTNKTELTRLTAE